MNNFVPRVHLENTVIVQVGEWRIKLFPGSGSTGGGLQLETIGAMGWCLMDDDGEVNDTIPDAVNDDLRAIVEALGRMW